MNYKVAVVIPTLNEEKFIARCLDSVIAQSYPFNDMDVMVVDGGSKDRTKDIVEEYKRKYQNIRFLNNPGRIQSIAFNIGVHSSDAPYIVRLDAHATYLLNHPARETPERHRIYKACLSTYTEGGATYSELHLIQNGRSFGNYRRMLGAYGTYAPNIPY